MQSSLSESFPLPSQHDWESLLEECFEASRSYKFVEEPEYGHEVFSFNLEDLSLDIEILPSVLAGFGTILADLTEQQKLLKLEISEYYGRLYVEITDALMEAAQTLKGPKASPSSKYDVEYRRGKIFQDPEYKRLVGRLIGLESRLDKVKVCYEALRSKQYLFSRLDQNNRSNTNEQ